MLRCVGSVSSRVGSRSVDTSERMLKLGCSSSFALSGLYAPVTRSLADSVSEWTDQNKAKL